MTRDWPRVIALAEELPDADPGKALVRLHAHCELAEVALDEGRLEQAAEKVRGTKVQPKVQPSLTAALAASDDLLALVEKLLLLARAEAGQGFAREPVALDEVVFEVAEMLRPLFAGQALALDLDLPVCAVTVAGDRVALGLLTRNLLDNALKFTAAGGVGVRVEARRGRAGPRPGRGADADRRR